MAKAKNFRNLVCNQVKVIHLKFFFTKNFLDIYFFSPRPNPRLNLRHLVMKHVKTLISRTWMYHLNHVPSYARYYPYARTVDFFYQPYVHIPVILQGEQLYKILRYLENLNSAHFFK